MRKSSVPLLVFPSLILILILFAFVGLHLPRCGRQEPQAPPSVPPEPRLVEPGHFVRADVLHAIDADTVRVRFGGWEGNVRLIGLDTPELGPPAEPWAEEAHDALWAVLPGDLMVYLEFDLAEWDQHGRRLAYVWRLIPREYSEAEIRLWMVNAAMLERGWARPLAVPPNLRYAELFEQLAREAKDAGKGLWAP
ncbi:MAG TPA: nuclease [Clostridiales bacterium]|nr:nuclease [Clostridiales bacterium]